MFENSSEELASHKLLILYILNKINMDLTNSQITQVVLETEMMNYFFTSTVFISAYGI